MDNYANRFHRNRDLINQERLDNILIVGIGGIGSQLVQLIAIMGFSSIQMWDSDIIEDVNLSSTIFKEENIDIAKVKAARNMIRELNSSTMIETNNCLFTNDADALPITVVCTDNMESRKIVYDRWLALEDSRKLFIDARMDSLSLQVITATKENDNYMSTWYNDSEVEPALCTMKHTIFTGALAAGAIVRNLFSVLMNHPYYLYEWHGMCPITIQTKHFIGDYLEV